MIPAVNMELDLCANFFGTNDESDVFQDNQLKNYHPIGVPLPILYNIKLHCKDWSKLFPKSTRR